MPKEKALSKYLDELIRLQKIPRLSNDGVFELERLIKNAIDNFSGKKRPSVTSILEGKGKRVSAYSDKSGLERGELPKGLHPLVEEWLKNAPEYLRRRPTHGKYAEPNAISKWLWM
ncbi:YwqJ-related putative deaminase [Pontimicrobium sp. MEBiC01747]